jgi:prepilin-type N-terminal cleavage/methylation domain-containing protein
MPGVGCQALGTACWGSCSSPRPESRNPKPTESGFTLIELVVVIAILGILVAIAVPVISGFLGSSKEQAYNADQKLLQVAVDAYYSRPNNERLLGKRQYPIAGKVRGGTAFAIPEGGVISPIIFRGTTSTNPLGGIQGGFPEWHEGRNQAADGIRNQPESEQLFHENTTVVDDDHWKSDLVIRETVAYVIDSRDYFIDFCELVRAGFLDDIPRSASPDHNCDPLGAGTGSYTWYIDFAGKVRSLYYFYPASTSEEDRGYQDVFP